MYLFVFFFNDTATTEIYTLSLHDALPILLYLDYSREAGQWIPNAEGGNQNREAERFLQELNTTVYGALPNRFTVRSEEHTSELQSRQYLVCRLLLEKKKKKHQSNLSINDL